MIIGTGVLPPGLIRIYNIEILLTAQHHDAAALRNEAVILQHLPSDDTTTVRFMSLSNKYAIIEYRTRNAGRTRRLYLFCTTTGSLLGSIISAKPEHASRTHGTSYSFGLVNMRESHNNIRVRVGTGEPANPRGSG